MVSKVSIVTGANKGIGLAVCRGLRKQVGGTIILTARNEQRGLAAVDQLNAEGCNTVFEQLDIADPISINRFKDRVHNKYNGIDILCNNAGHKFPVHTTNSAFEKASVTMATNLVGTRNVTNYLLPLMNQGGRICNVAALLGILNWCFPDQHNPYRLQLLSDSLTEQQILEVMEDYVTAMKHEDFTYFKDSPYAAYLMSKVLLIALTRVQGVALMRDPRGIMINSCFPGFVNTDLSGNMGPLTPDKGAISPLMVCQLPDGAGNGRFFNRKKKVDWATFVTAPAPKL